MVTANVQTLGKGPQGYQGKLHFLQQQFAEYAIHAIGIQEARTDEIFCGRQSDYLRLSTGHDRGHHGVELWPCYFAAHHLVVLHKDPRRLLVRVTTPHLDCIFLCTTRTAVWSTRRGERTMVDQNCRPIDPLQGHCSALRIGRLECYHWTDRRIPCPSFRWHSHGEYWLCPGLRPAARLGLYVIYGLPSWTPGYVEEPWWTLRAQDWPHSGSGFLFDGALWYWPWQWRHGPSTSWSIP